MCVNADTSRKGESSPLCVPTIASMEWYATSYSVVCQSQGCVDKDGGKGGCHEGPRTQGRCYRGVEEKTEEEEFPASGPVLPPGQPGTTARAVQKGEERRPDDLQPEVPPGTAGTTGHRYYRPFTPELPVPARTPDENSPLACNLPLRTPLL